MQASTDRIQVSHAGSLPRTPELVAANAAREFEEDGFTLKRSPEYDALLQDAVTGLVQHQLDVGVTAVGDGEFGKASSNPTDYGAWWVYSFQRVTGLSLTEVDAFNEPPHRSSPGNIRLTAFSDRRDRQEFADVYADPTAIHTGRTATLFPSVTGPIEYRGEALVAADIANLKHAIAETGAENGFITSISPGSAARIVNDHYASEEEHVWAWAEALRHEYKAITDAGLILQIDDPSMAENWDAINPEPSVADYIAFTRIRLEALNHALAGLPTEQIRFHLCWGSWHGPHTTDIEFKHIVDTMLDVNAIAYSFEAANARHEHEWTIWEDTELPDGKLIVPGIVGHATNVVEHPELVAQRIENFARLVGPERVIASTDCGLGGRVHQHIAWAKLESLAAGADIATRRLFR